MFATEELTAVTGTPRATAMLRRLAHKNGPLVIFQSGGCCDGSLPLCLLASEMAPSPNDVLLGHVGNTPFYIDKEQYERWGEPEFLLDVAGGAPEGFSLGEPDGHFVSAPLSGWACETVAA
jgi:uncharacterized protein